MKCQVVLFRNTDGFIARLIRWQTDSKYCHAALLFNDTYLIESTGPRGVEARYFNKDHEECDIFDVENLTEEDKAFVYAFASSQRGKGYDFWGVLRFISRSRLPENDRWFCSELVFEAFRAAEVNLLDRVEPWQVAPGDLAISPKLKLVK
jgi:uncharacterized protein YycO